MGSIPLKLDSSTLEGQDSDNFTVNFANGIILNTQNQQMKYEIALITLDTWYSWNNISSDYNNKTFRYYNGSTWRTLTLPDGNYTVSDINDYLHDQMENYNDYTTDAVGEKLFDLHIEGNVVTNKVRLRISNSYQLDFSTSDLNLLLGFDKTTYDTSIESPNRPDMTRGVNNLIVNCSIVAGSYQNGLSSGVLYAFSPNNSRGSSIHVEPNNPIYVPISEVQQITRITMRITDQQGRRINFNGEPVSYFLNIRPMKYTV